MISDQSMDQYPVQETNSRLPFLILSISPFPTLMFSRAAKSALAMISVMPF